MYMINTVYSEELETISNGAVRCFDKRRLNNIGHPPSAGVYYDDATLSTEGTISGERVCALLRRTYACVYTRRRTKRQPE